MRAVSTMPSRGSAARASAAGIARANMSLSWTDDHQLLLLLLLSPAAAAAPGGCCVVAGTASEASEAWMQQTCRGRQGWLLVLLFPCGRGLLAASPWRKPGGAETKTGRQGSVSLRVEWSWRTQRRAARESATAEQQQDPPMALLALLRAVAGFRWRLHAVWGPREPMQRPGVALEQQHQHDTGSNRERP
jgi:hypothetical protein